MIILHNTLRLFEKEIEEVLPTLASEELAQQKKAYFAKRASILESNKRELTTFEETYRATLDNIADRICVALDEVLPDVLINFLHSQIKEYSKTENKVNTSQHIENGILHMSYVDYPVDFFVQSAIVASLIKEKCASLLVDGSIRMHLLGL